MSDEETPQNRAAMAVQNSSDAPDASVTACIPCAAKKSGQSSSPVPNLTPAEADKVLKRALKNQARLLKLRKGQIKRWNKKDQQLFKTWFGATDQASRKRISDRIDKELALNAKMTTKNFKASPKVDPGTFAYVNPDDKSHTIYIDGAFSNAPATGENSQAGTLAHEMSHFTSVGGTDDHEYGTSACKKLAKQKPADALDNADSFEYFIEGVH